MEQKPQPIPEKEEELEADPEPETFIKRLDAGEFDGRLFEEIRKLRAEHLARVCRLLSRRKFEET